jgi:hypothetical protein
MTEEYMVSVAKSHFVSATKVVELQLKLFSDYNQHLRELNFLMATIHERSTREVIDRYYERMSEDFFSEDGL